MPLAVVLDLAFPNLPILQLEVKVPKSCEVACVKKLKKSEKEAFVRAIEDDYKVSPALQAVLHTSLV